MRRQRSRFLSLSLGLFLLLVPGSTLARAELAATATPIRAVTVPLSPPATTARPTPMDNVTVSLPTPTRAFTVTTPPAPELSTALPLTGSLGVTVTASPRPTPRATPRPSATREVTPALAPWVSVPPNGPLIAVESPLVRRALLLGGGALVLLLLGGGVLVLLFRRRITARLEEMKEESEVTELSPLHRETQLGGRYILDRQVGAGSLGTVWLAEDTVLRRKVAIKALHPQVQIEAMSGGRSPVEDLYWEATSTARMEHPNIVRIHDMQRWGDEVPLYVVMEYIEGSTLKDLLDKSFGKPLHDATVWGVAQGVLRALEYAHQHGVIHRDLKPGNIMLSKGGGDFRIVVVDWGLCLRLSGEALHAIPRSLRTDKLVGSYNYMSPEQWQGQPLDHCADLYAFGVILFEMLTGRLPFYARASTDLAYLHLMQPPPEVSAFRPNLRPEVGKIVDALLAKIPKKRPASATAVLEMLAPLAGRLSEDDDEGAGEGAGEGEEG